MSQSRPLTKSFFNSFRQFPLTLPQCNSLQKAWVKIPNFSYRVGKLYARAYLLKSSEMLFLTCWTREYKLTLGVSTHSSRGMQCLVEKLSPALRRSDFEEDRKQVPALRKRILTKGLASTSQARQLLTPGWLSPKKQGSTLGEAPRTTESLLRLVAEKDKLTKRLHSAYGEPEID